MADFLRDWWLDPLGLLFLLSLWLCLRLFRCRRWFGMLLALVWIAAMLLSSSPLVVNALLADLENRHPQNPVCPVESTLVVVGAGVDPRITRIDEFERLSPASLARLAEGLRRLDEQPYARLVLAGTVIRDISEAEVLADLALRTGVQPRQLLLERTAGTTVGHAERINAVLRDAGLPPRIQLITSALHLPRARAVFEQRGFEVCAVPVDHQALDSVPVYAVMPRLPALVAFDRWVREQLATNVRRLQGQL